MNFNILGRTNLKVSEIGIGTEHLFFQSNNVIKSVVHKAIDNDINYFDVLFSVKQYLEKLANAFKGYRDQLVITGHLGTIEFEGRAKRNRNSKECKNAFLRMLSILEVNYVDILNIQYVKANEYDKLMKPGGLMEIALSFKEEGKARFLGLSTHDTSVVMQAIKNELFDMIMFPINLANHGLKDREKILKLCLKSKMGLVGIKPFAGGKLLNKNRTTYFAKYQTAGLSFKKKVPTNITPSHCIKYVKSLPEVSLILMGVKNTNELNENLKYLTMKESELDYSAFIKIFQ